ncbi:MAG: hypothetical protein EOM80_09695 [Erysipelotrichia bacterium]|nr:hypothetical protein [Erysipelotrichia bacterium]
MLTKQEQENLLKASHSAGFLTQELMTLTKSTNPLLADIAIEILSQAVQIKERLNRLESATNSLEKSV